MCVLALAWRASPQWRLVVAGNRDEFHDRAALPLARWEDALRVIGGRDVLGGGTWLGVAEGGRFAVVTNVRAGPPDRHKLSRGALVSDMLRRGSAAIVSALPEAYNPFNLIAIDGDQVHFMTNRPEGLVQPLGPGMHGLSNGVMDKPWPKTKKLERAVAEWIERGTGERETLFAALADEEPPRGMTGYGGDRDEPEGSPIFIRNPRYGTRCSTVVTVDAEGHGVIAERRFDAKGNAVGDSEVEFLWPEVAP